MHVPVKIIVSVAVAGTFVLTACSSSGGGSKPQTTPTSSAPAPVTSTPAAPTTPPATSSSAAPTPADAATTAAVTKAYTTFFGGTKDQAKLVADLQNGDKLTAALIAEAKNPTAATLTATVSKVVLANPHVANVTFTLLSKGAPLLSNQPGNAVLVNGTWTLAAGTFCGLVAAAGPLPAACSDTSITRPRRRLRRLPASRGYASAAPAC